MPPISVNPSLEQSPNDSIRNLNLPREELSQRVMPIGASWDGSLFGGRFRFSRFETQQLRVNVREQLFMDDLTEKQRYRFDMASLGTKTHHPSLPYS
jgi:hypothetical protein